MTIDNEAQAGTPTQQSITTDADRECEEIQEKLDEIRRRKRGDLGKSPWHAKQAEGRAAWESKQRAAMPPTAPAAVDVAAPVAVPAAASTDAPGQPALPADPWQPGNEPDDSLPAATGATAQPSPPASPVPAPETVNGWVAPDLSEPAAARLFVAAARGSLLYVPDAGWGWMSWDGRRWVQDTVMRRNRIVIDVMCALHHKAADAPTPEWQKRISGFAVASQYSRRVASLIATASSDPSIQACADDFDANPHVLNCQNGVVDLRTGRIRPHDPRRLITMITPVPYEPAASKECFLKFIGEVLPDLATVNFVQRAAGMSAFGMVRDHALLFLYGEGANGKTTLVETLREALGDYADAAPNGLLMAIADDKGDFEAADLRGKRMVISSETGARWRLNESRVKKLAGGDLMKGRGVHQGFTRGWVPSHHIWLQSNHEPRIEGQDEGIWRRILKVEFPVIHRDGRDTDPARAHLPVIDTTLRERIRRELPGVLAWMVHGAAWWFRNGLMPPETVRSATRDYRKREDRIPEWLAESPSFLSVQGGGEVLRLYLASEVKATAERAGEKAPTDPALTACLRRLGMDVRATKRGKTVFLAGVPAATQGGANA